MVKRIIAAIFILVIAGGCQAQLRDLDQPVYDLERGRKTNLSELTADLKKNRIILVGEHHSNESHHRAQLTVIQALTQAYRMIFRYARENQIPMIGLNVSRDITRQVSLGGFQSLSKEAKGKLSDVACRVDKAYMQYIRKAFGAHAHGNLNFIYFCEAQLVWDNIMAINILNYLNQHPDTVVVALTGTGHAQKVAVPRQISSRSQLPYTVILPEVPGSIDAQTVSTKEADYIILDP